MRKSHVLMQLLLSLALSSCTAYGGQGGGGEKIPDPTKAPTKTPKSTPRDPKPTSKPSLPKPKAPTVADLSINSNLSGCSVTLNNRASGVTDSSGSLYLRSLKPGYYTVMLAKAGYQSIQQSINLSAGESQSLSFQITAVPGTLTVTTDVSGAQIEISNAGSYSDRVSGLTLAPGSYHLTASKPGYRTTPRDFEIKTGETTTLSLNLEAIPVEETLAEALMAYNSKDYGRVFSLCNQVLSRESNNAKAHWLIGLSYYGQGRYADSVEPFAQAIAAGGQVRLNIRHRRFVFGAGDDLSNGVLSLDQARFGFTSNDRPGDSFTVPFSKVLNVKKELKRAQFGEWRFEIKVAIPKKDGKEDKKDFDFYSMRSGTKQVIFEGNKYPTSVIYCDDCEGEIDAFYQLISRVKAMPPPAAVTNSDILEGPTLKRRGSESSIPQDMSFVDTDEAGKHYKKAQTYLNQQRPDEASKELALAIRLRPDFSMAHYDLGVLLITQKRWEEALNQFRSAVSGDMRPSWLRAWVHIKVGNIYDAKGDRPRAVSHYSRALATEIDYQGAQTSAKGFISTPYDPSSPKQE